MTFAGSMCMGITKKVKKPIEAIQCSNTFSLLQRKMYNVLLANAAGNLHPDATHRITMRVLCHLMGYNSNDYRKIKQKFRELRRMDMEWDIINEQGNKVWTNTSPLSLARVIEGEGICEYEFTPSLVPFLDRPAQYAKFSLSIQSKFKSSYGLALYENCERYKKIFYTRIFDIQTFRKLMGVASEEYIEFFAFKRRVINKAVKEVNEHADFIVEPDYQKKGRKVVGIRFLIHPKEENINNKLIEKPKNEEELLKKIDHYFNLSQRSIQTLLKKYGYKYLDDKIKYILSSDSFKKGLIKNMGGYLKIALRDDHQSNISSQGVLENKRREKERIDQLEAKKKELEEMLRNGYNRYLSSNIDAIFLRKLEKEQRLALMSEFKPYISQTMYAKTYHKEGLKDILVRDSFVEFLNIKRKDLLDKLVPYNEYVENKEFKIFQQLQVIDKTIQTQRLVT